MPCRIATIGRAQDQGVIMSRFAADVSFALTS